MKRAEPAGPSGKLSGKQIAQRMRRLREKEEQAKFKVPPRGENYGRAVLAAGDERTQHLIDIMHEEMAPTAHGLLPMVGITLAAYQRWMELGEADFASGTKSPEAHFFDEVKRAEGYAEIMLRRLSLDAKTIEERRTARWLLERCIPDRYALKRDNSGAPDVIDALGELFEAGENAKLAEARVAFASVKESDSPQPAVVDG